MATKKKLLQAAAGTAAASGGAGGAAGLNVEQVFSTYLYEGNGGSKTIQNGINLGQSQGSGSIEFAGNNNYITASSSDFAFGTGNWTVEAFVNVIDGAINHSIFDNRADNVSATGFNITLRNDRSIRITTSGLIIISTITGIYNRNEWQHIAVTRSGSTIRVHVNGTEIANATTSVNSSNGSVKIGENVGNSSEMRGYLSNLRVVKGSALYGSGNFTAPTSPLTAVTNTVLLIGHGETPLTDSSSSAHTLTTNDDVLASSFGPFDAADAGEGGLVWLKKRTAVENHLLFDTERGVTDKLETNTTDAESSDIDTLTSFNANGFSIGADTEINSGLNTYASWTFRKAPKFFTCLTYSGTGTAQTISHDLGTTVGTLIVKRTDSSDSWRVYHRGMDATSPQNYFIALNGYSQKTAASTIWNNTAPTDTTFTVGTSSSVNASGGTYVAYLFAHNDGDGDFGDGTQDIIKCGSYTGNGSSTGPEIDLGFEPQWVLVKNANANENWMILDSMRGFTSGVTDGDARLYPNLNNAEAAGTRIKPLPNGFQPEDSDPQINSSGSTYIYIAIRRGPMAVPTDATDVFSTTVGTNTTDWTYNAGFPVDWTLYTARTGGDNFTFNRMTGSKYLTTNSNLAENSYTVGFDNMSFVDISPSTNNGFVIWDWKRAPNFFDVVAYTGNGTAGRTVSHNLGVAPEMMWVKLRDGTLDWAVYHKDLYNGRLWLNDTNAYTASSMWNNTLAGADSFTVGSSSYVNLANRPFIAYLFASLDGVSKVGSYTGNGTSQTIDCGFSSGARFVLIKRTDSTSDWWVFDTERGIVAGNDSLLALNGNAAESTGYDNIDPDSSGFIINNTAWNENASGGSYIFYAVA